MQFVFHKSLEGRCGGVNKHESLQACLLSALCLDLKIQVSHFLKPFVNGAWWGSIYPLLPLTGERMPSNG